LLLSKQILRTLVNGYRYLCVLVACASLAWPQAVPPTPCQPSSYTLGSGDQVSLYVTNLEDNFTEKTFRIDSNGDLSLPMIGRIHAGGLTQAELEDQVKNQFGRFLKEPDIVVNVTEYASQAVSVNGAVNMPGVKQLQGSGRTLFDALALAQGLRPDAGTTVTITRDLQNGPIPLPGSTVSSNGQYSIATVHLKEVMQASTGNIVVRPGDTIFVPKADVVYAVGSVKTPGGFPIGENEALSALQVVALAQGLINTAASNRAKILRILPGTVNRTEIPIDLKLLLAGKAPDTPLLPGDILFVPNSGAKTAEYRTIDAIVSAASGLAILGSRF
jgi:polysaccharide export outer membrane protein